MRKKLLAIIATAAMVVTMIPSMVFADSGSPATTLPPAQEGVITLNEDVSLTTAVEIEDDVVIDLNGFTLESAANTAIEINAPGSDKVEVEIKNGTIKGNRGISVREENVSLKVSNVVFNISGDVGIGNWAENNDITIEYSKITVIGDDSFGVYQNGSYGGNTFNITESVIKCAPSNDDGIGIYISGSSSLTKKQELVLADCIVEGPTAVETKFTDVTINGGVYKATVVPGTYTGNSNGSTTVGSALAITDNADGNTGGAIKIKDGVFFAEYGGEAILHSAKAASSKAVFDIKGGSYNTNIKELLKNNEVILYDEGMTYEYGIIDETIKVEDDFYTVYENEDDVIKNGGAIYEKEGIYYMWLPEDADEDAYVRIAYDVYFYAINPNGIEDLDKSTYLTIPANNNGIKEYLDDTGKKIEVPNTVDGYKFIGWYEAESYDGWDGDDAQIVMNLKYSSKTVDMDTPVKEDMEYFAAWEKNGGAAGTGDADKPAKDATTDKTDNAAATGDNMNMALPITVAGLALAAMVAVVATRRRHN